MIKTLRIGNSVIIFFKDNTSVIHGLKDEEEYIDILEIKDKEEYYQKYASPEINKVIQETKEAKKRINNLKQSKLLTFIGDSAYWKGISELSLPPELIDKILDAEHEGNTRSLTAYKNFWTLMSLNPNAECRRDLFKFLCKYGMTISKSGFFVGYRNVDTTGTPNVYTDHRSHTFTIKIGEMVVMDRSECDCRNNVICSKGLICSPLY